MKKLISILMFFMLLVMPVQVHAAQNISLNKEMCIKQSVVNLSMEERKLWCNHVLWTRNFIISDLAGLEDKSKVLEKLFKNQVDIGNSIKAYYGRDNAKKFTELLKEHIALAGKFVDAAKIGNRDALQKYDELWHQNADKIADFLNGLNSEWSKDKLKDILYKHLELTTDEVLARVNKKWNEDISSYDKSEDHILKFADFISDGIVKQFPDKFK